MANFRAVYAVGESLRSYLRNTYPANLPTIDIQLISSGQLAETEELNDTLTLMLYRITTNEHMRNVQQSNGFSQQRILPLVLDLHYLMTVWADSAVDEQVVLGWAMRQFHQHPVFDASSLVSTAEWNVDEVVQLIPVDLSHEDIMRIWDRLKPPYHLSVSYVARVVRIEPDRPEEYRPVVATRFGLEGKP